MVINFKKLIWSILIALGAGVVGNLLGGGMDVYDTIVKPSFAVPPIVFPIVWTVLYILMGISAYIISTSDSKNKDMALGIYAVQLVVNALWPLFFFRFQMFFVSFLWLLLLIALVIAMIIAFYKIRPIAAYLQIPYLAWLIFASVLNFAIYRLN